MNRILIGTLALAALAVAACGGSSSSTGSSGGAASVSSSGASASGALATGSTSLGTVLTNAQGYTLYYFTPEQGGTIACTGSCASTWPPLKASGTPAAPSGVSGTLGTVTLSDGSMEVTYNGWPLHIYSGDTAAGQTNGQGIGGKWYAATPGLTATGSGSASASASSSPYGY